MNAQTPFGEDVTPTLELIPVGAWAGQSAPPRPWIVENWLPSRAVTLLAGDGGTGKSLMVQQWLSALSQGLSFMGVRGVQPVRCLYVNCEDERDELQRRQEDIARSLDRQMATFAGDMTISPRLGHPDNSLGNFDHAGRFIPGDLLLAVKAACAAHRYRVVALDNVAHLFTGNENIRGEVTAFLNALSRLALEIDGAVILLGHPSKADGSEYSGSTAWENGVRNRLYLARPDDGDGNTLDNRRTLSRNKANLASIGDKLKMVWHAGAFYPPGAVEAETGREALAEVAFLACLDKKTSQGVNVSESVNAADKYAPRLFATMPEAAGIGKKALELAMQRLFDAGEIVIDHALWKGPQRKPVKGIARAKPCAESCAEPAPSGAPSVRQACADPAPTCAERDPYTTYNNGGALGAPAIEEHTSGDLGPGDWVPDYAPDTEPPVMDPWL